MISVIQGRILSLKRELLAGNLGALLTQFSDILLVGCVGAMVGMMIVPLPTWLLDILLTINITIAVTLLMVSIYISNATQIASYPTLLLITTLYRLSLDISATRLILLQANAGEVIRAFGMFVVSGNFVVGAVIFLIITLVQFIVITKGAERVAEVSARFTLDAMPGKQMSIDADMRSGIIDFQEARSRREALGRESQFYGAMDGAMKFVKGDAIAGIIITLINILGGLIIGVGMRGMEVMKAVQTYSILTIGNGLVCQIPALLISISAGMVVTRVASETRDSNLGRDVATQILAQPKAIAVSSGLLLVMAVIPGLPKIPFLLMAILTGSVAYGLFNATKIKRVEEEKGSEKAKLIQEPKLSVTVPLVLELGEALASLVHTSTPEGIKFHEMLGKIRNGLYYELGVIFPSIQISANSSFEPGKYVIWLNEVPVVSGQIRLEALLVNASAKSIFIYGIKGEDARNPATGKAATWISKDLRQRAAQAGLQIWDTSEILMMHLAHFLRKHAKEFLGLQEVQRMVSGLREYYPDLAEEVVPKIISLQQLTEILQRLVEEEVSARDLKTILQCLSEWGRSEHDVVTLTEQVRIALKRKICYQLAEGNVILYVYQLSPEIEGMFRNSVRQTSSGPYLTMEPAMIQEFMDAAHAQIGNLPPTAQRPVILTKGDIRRFVKRLLDYKFPEVAVLSYEQLTPEITVQPLGYIELGPSEPSESQEPQQLRVGE